MRPVSLESAAVGFGLLGDRLLGEPAAPIHPVARFGDAMSALENRMWADNRFSGVVFCALGVGGAWFVGRVLEEVAGSASALGVSVTVASAGRALCAAAEVVDGHLAAGDLQGARREVVALVGRDPTDLDEGEIARAVVESLAENLSDAVVATALWGLLAGAPGALAHRAANTLDAMVGYHEPRYERFGWASARLDDVLGWPAARLCVLLVAVAAPRRARDIVRTTRGHGPRHPSPNAGVVEAALAAALGLRLGGTNSYGSRVEERPHLGQGAPPGRADIGRSIALVRRCIAILEGALVAWAGLGGLFAAKKRSMWRPRTLW